MQKKTKTRAISEEWQIFQSDYREGRITLLVDERQKLLDWIKQEKLEGEDLWKLQAMAAQISCILLDRRKAVECLEGFLTLSKDTEEVVEVNDKKLSDVERKCSPIVMGFLLSNIANVLYRHLQYSQGVHYARKAEVCFEGAEHMPQVKGAPPTAGDSLDLLIFRAENQVWLCRLLYQEGGGYRLEEVERRLDETVDILTTFHEEEHPGEEILAGIDLRQAIALELWAVLLWRSQKLDEARRRIYRALFVFRSRRGLRDIVRLSFALYTAGRIEGSQTRRNYRWAIDLERQAIENYRRLEGAEVDVENPRAGQYYKTEDLQHPLQHPFLARTQVQHAQLLIKAERIKEARKELEQAEASLRKLRDIDPREANYVEWQWRLGWTWLYQHEARKNPARWQKVLEEAQKLPESLTGVPKSLQLKKHFHAGLALMHLDGAQERGRKLLEEGVERARKSGQVKMEVACNLALAEGLLNVSRKDSFSYLSEAQRLVERVQSTFLEKWTKELTFRIGAPVPINLTQPFDEAEEEFQRAYFQFHKVQEQDREEAILRATRLERSRYYRKLKDLGLTRKKKKRAEIQP